jgi:SAM-dependent methyltransferase
VTGLPREARENRRDAASAPAAFRPLGTCWVCGGDRFIPLHQCRFDLREYGRQDPELAAYTGSRVWIQRCRGCGFAQPQVVPDLSGYFDRMYDQRWSDEWIDAEFRSEAKTLIFRDVLSALAKRVRAPERRLLDIGAHVGRFMQLAQRAGWAVEGIELNPRTAAYAARRTGAPVYRLNAEDVVLRGRRVDAVTLIDALEHIPDPVRMLTTARQLLEPGGWIAVKVPDGPNQLLKERLRARLKRHYQPSIADNLVHVNHFSPRSLVLALERAGFTSLRVVAAAPELPGPSHLAIWRRPADVGRLALFRVARLLPGGVHSPLALNLQAYGRRP